MLITLLLSTGAIHAQNCAPLPPGLVAWWKGDGNANDTTGTYPSTFANGISFTDGKVGQAFGFNGVDSQISFGNALGNFDTSDFTIEFWIRTTATRQESVIEKRPACSSGSFWGIRMGGSALGAGRLGVEVESATGSDANTISTGRAINDGLFHHVAFVRQGTSLAFYIDGILDVPATQSSSGLTNRINNTAT